MTIKEARGRYEEAFFIILCHRGSLGFAMGEHPIPTLKQDISKLFFFQEKIPAAPYLLRRRFNPARQISIWFFPGVVI
jgi:hypothetical protein